MAPEQVLQQEEYEFSDPVTQFLTCLYVDFDFEGAQQKLAECETVLENDFFLTALKVRPWRKAGLCILAMSHQLAVCYFANSARLCFISRVGVFHLQRSAEPDS